MLRVLRMINLWPVAGFTFRLRDRSRLRIHHYWRLRNWHRRRRRRQPHRHYNRRQRHLHNWRRRVLHYRRNRARPRNQSAPSRPELPTAQRHSLARQKRYRRRFCPPTNEVFRPILPRVSARNAAKASTASQQNCRTQNRKGRFFHRRLRVVRIPRLSAASSPVNSDADKPASRKVQACSRKKQCRHPRRNGGRPRAGGGVASGGWPLRRQRDYLWNSRHSACR